MSGPLADFLATARRALLAALAIFLRASSAFSPPRRSASSNYDSAKDYAWLLISLRCSFSIDLAK